MMMNNRWVAAIVALAAIALWGEARAAYVYSTPGELYEQNFDTLPHNSPVASKQYAASFANSSLGASPAGWINDTASPGPDNFSIVGWHLLHPTDASEGGFNGNQRMRFGTGNGAAANTGAFWSYGSGSNESDRALGILNSNALSGTTPTSMPVFMGAVFTNNTGVTLNEFTLSYFGEQWRNNSPDAHSLLFDYSLDASSIQDTGATRIAVPALNFTGPLTGGTNAGGQGNAAGRVAIGPVTVTGLNWAPGQNLWIRWSDRNDPGDDHGLAIDDLIFSANTTVVPEPASCLLLLTAVVAGIFRRRR